MLQRLEITNYRSIASAVVELRPFTILVGANGSGKSNLLKLLSDLGDTRQGPGQRLTRHLSMRTAPTLGQIASTEGTFEFTETRYSKPPELEAVRVFSIDPTPIGLSESLIEKPEVRANGVGAVQVLDTLKTGDREDLFDTIERQLREFVPEIEKLSFVPSSHTKASSSSRTWHRHSRSPSASSPKAHGSS